MAQNADDDLKSNWTNDRSARQWCREKGLIPTTGKCPYCESRLTSVTYGSKEMFVCRQLKSHANRQAFRQSIFANTWFGKTKISVMQILHLMYCFVNKCKISESMADANVSNSAAIDWFQNCREVCMKVMMSDYEQGKMGGPGCIVEVDECKLVRKDFRRRGHPGQWIFAMIDRGTKEVRLELCPEKRDKVDMLSFMQKHIEPGTTIISDCWEDYSWLTDAKYNHLTHSEHIQDSESDGCSETTENLWRHLRQRLCRGGVRKSEMPFHLAEYLWRLRCLRNQVDPFQQLVDDIKMLYPGKNAWSG